MSVVIKPALTETRKMNRPELRVPEVTVKARQFSSEEMDQIIYLATMRAEARAELRLTDK